DSEHVMAYSPDGKTLAYACTNNTIRLWHGAGEPVVLGGHGGTIGSLAFSPDGKRLASGGADDTVRVWGIPATTARPKSPPPPEYREGPTPEQPVAGIPCVRGNNAIFVDDVVFSPDGKTLAGRSGMEVELWDPATGKLRHMLSGHLQNITR